MHVLTATLRLVCVDDELQGACILLWSYMNKCQCEHIQPLD